MATILLIDDDVSVRETLKDMLESANHSVIDAESGLAGLEIFTSRSVDLVVTDIVMHQGEGLETIMAMKRIDPNVNVIAISGMPSKKDLLRYAQESGADATLEKPVSVGDLLDAVRQFTKT